MTLLVVERSPLVTKVRAVIRADGWRCETGRPPTPASGEVAPRTPYVILYPIDGGGFSGPPLGAPDNVATFTIQATSVGETAGQAEMMADRVRRLLLGRNATGYLINLDDADSGQKVRGRWSEGAGSIDIESKLVTLPERFGFFVSL
jgi:hypothetical protein